MCACALLEGPGRWGCDDCLLSPVNELVLACREAEEARREAADLREEMRRQAAAARAEMADMWETLQVRGKKEGSDVVVGVCQQASVRSALRCGRVSNHQRHSCNPRIDVTHPHVSVSQAHMTRAAPTHAGPVQSAPRPPGSLDASAADAYDRLAESGQATARVGHGDTSGVPGVVEALGSRVARVEREMAAYAGVTGEMGVADDR